MSDIFDNDELTAAAVTDDEPVTPQPDDQQQQIQPEGDPSDPRPRDEFGRFLPKEGEAVEGEEKPRTVNHGALHQEREKRKHWEGEAKKAQEQLAAIAEMRQRLSQASTQPIEQPQAPQADGDHSQYLAQQIQELQQLERDRQLRGHSQEADQRERNVLADALTRSEQEFRSAQPDYNEAATYLAQARARELQRYGLSIPDIQSTLAQEAMDLTAGAIRQGMSPAELAYQIAQDRGYRPQQQQAATPTPPAQSSAAAMIAGITRAQNASKSLGGAGGATSAADLNAAAVAAMSADEFEKLYSTKEGRALIDSLG